MMKALRIPVLTRVLRPCIQPLLSILAVVGFVAAAGGAETQNANGAFSTDVSLSEIMESIVMPSADVLWNAVSVAVSAQGEVDTVPETDEEWAQLRWSAVNLAAATNLLLIPGTPIANPAQAKETPEGELGPDQIAALQKDNWQAWTAHATVLHDAAMAAISMIDSKNADGLSEVGGAIDAACEGCHLQFWYPEG